MCINFYSQNCSRPDFNPDTLKEGSQYLDTARLENHNQLKKKKVHLGPMPIKHPINKHEKCSKSFLHI